MGLLSKTRPSIYIYGSLSEISGQFDKETFRDNCWAVDFLNHLGTQLAPIACNFLVHMSVSKALLNSRCICCSSFCLLRGFPVKEEYYIRHIFWWFLCHYGFFILLLFLYSTCGCLTIYFWVVRAGWQFVLLLVFLLFTFSMTILTFLCRNCQFSLFSAGL